MNVVLAVECGESDRVNPYTTQLHSALVARLGSSQLVHGVQQFWSARQGIGVLHLQWPEALVGLREPGTSDLERIAGSLQAWKREGTRIVVTIHNAHPHGVDSEYYRELYRMVYEAADGFVHLGDASIKFLFARFPEAVSGAAHRVIPHGDYSCLQGEGSAQEAKQSLGIPAGAQVVASIGRIRDVRELRLLSRGFDLAKLKQGLLLVAGRLPSSSRKQLGYYQLRWPYFVSRRKRLSEGLIPAGEIQKYVRAADVLAIPRIDNMNSGNIALGFTFARVVVGPDIGVIGEQLRLTGNPVFDPASPESFGEALVKGMEQAGKGQGDRNLKWAEEHMSWTRVADMHLDFYQDLTERAAARCQ
ncbi:MAG: hypothetical protein EOP14_02520 [Pseudomonas sp.]|nr:MAG: hypothetical protein EOP14_02520 [Pseudomonas sp.]